MGTGLIVLAMLVVAAVGGFLVLRRRLRDWGASPRELENSYPADDLVGGATMRATRAVTVNAPVTEVWPWMAQTGRGAGWYALDVLDNWGRRSADYLMTLPEPAVGDESAIGRIAAVQPGRSIAWLLQSTPMLGCRFDVSFNHLCLPLDENRTRLLLVVRMARCSGPAPAAWLGELINDVMETVMGIRQLRTLKRMIESYPERLRLGAVHKATGRHGHQRYDYRYAHEAKSDNNANP